MYWLTLHSEENVWKCVNLEEEDEIEFPQVTVLGWYESSARLERREEKCVHKL